MEHFIKYFLQYKINIFEICVFFTKNVVKIGAHEALHDFTNFYKGVITPINTLYKKLIFFII